MFCNIIKLFGIPLRYVQCLSLHCSNSVFKNYFIVGTSSFLTDSSILHDRKRILIPRYKMVYTILIFNSRWPVESKIRFRVRCPWTKHYIRHRTGWFFFLSQNHYLYRGVSNLWPAGRFRPSELLTDVSRGNSFRAYSNFRKTKIHHGIWNFTKVVTLGNRTAKMLRRVANRTVFQTLKNVHVKWFQHLALHHLPCLCEVKKPIKNEIRPIKV